MEEAIVRATVVRVEATAAPVEVTVRAETAVVLVVAEAIAVQAAVETTVVQAVAPVVAVPGRNLRRWEIFFLHCYLLPLDI